MAEHRNLTGASLHECKGADAASADTVLIADGAGATSWAKLTSSNLDGSSIFSTNKFVVPLQLADVSTDSFVLLPITFPCTLTKVTTILHASISGSNDTITVTNSNGPATAATLTITQSGSAEGDIDSTTVASNNSFTNGTYVKIHTDGASSNTAALTILLEFTVTGSS